MNVTFWIVLFIIKLYKKAIFYTPMNIGIMVIFNRLFITRNFPGRTTPSTIILCKTAGIEINNDGITATNLSAPVEALRVINF